MTVRLLQLAMGRWEELDGYALAHGMPDLRTLPLGRVCNFIYWRTTEGADSVEVEKFRTKLWMPPKGEAPDARSPWSAENETNAFAAFKASFGGAREAPPKKGAA